MKSPTMLGIRLGRARAFSHIARCGDAWPAFETQMIAAASLIWNKAVANPMPRGAGFPACGIVAARRQTAALLVLSSTPLFTGWRSANSLKPLDRNISATERTSYRALGLLCVLVTMLFSQAWCAAAATLSVSSASIPTGSSINLSAAGSLDWVHWGLFTSTSLDRKAGVVPLIGNFKALSGSMDTNAYTYAYQFSDNENGYNWSDGSPDGVVTNTTTGVWAYATPPPQFGSGFEIRVPVDTATRTLKVYAGAYAADAKFEAFLSDGSVPVYTETRMNFFNGPSWVFTLTYSGDPSAELIVRWTVSRTMRIDGNVTLQSAALTGNGENNPPAVSITSPAENATFASPANVTITASASDLDGAISKVEFYDGDSRLGQAVSSPYTFTWMNAPPGYHVLTAVATDTNADFTTSMPVEIFVNTTGGALSGSLALPTNRLDLTLEGTTDWAHWGLDTNTIFNHKSGVTQQISDVTVLGMAEVQRYEDNHTAFSWSDGTPTPTATNSTTGLFITGVTNGFRIQVPADTTHRRLKVYVGLYGARGNFQAWLSDSSAKAYTDTSISNLYQSSYAVVTLDYAAASAGQSLIVQFKSLVLYDLDFGNVTWQAATLVGEAVSIPPGITQQPVSQAVNLGANVQFSVGASGTAPLAYQWRFGMPGVGGGNIPGATNSTLTITNAQLTNAGNYRVIITNSAGSTNSVVATLTVNVGPLQLGYEAFLINGTPALRIFPTVAQPYALDSSSNLASWTAIFTNQTGATASNYTQGVINKNYRFFRGRRWP